MTFVAKPNKPCKSRKLNKQCISEIKKAFSLVKLDFPQQTNICSNSIIGVLEKIVNIFLTFFDCFHC